MIAALMRRLMSFDTSVTRAFGCSRCSATVLREDRVVGAVAGQRVRQAGRRVCRVWKNSRPRRRLLAAVHGLRGRQLEAAVDLLLGRARHQLVEEAADLADVARRLGHALLAGVEFLEHGHRDEDVVLLEPEDRGRVVHQHVGVEHEDAALGGRLLGRQRRAPGNGEGAIGECGARAYKAASGREDLVGVAVHLDLAPLLRAARPSRRSGTCCARRPCTSCRTCSFPSTRRTAGRPSCPRRRAARTGSRTWP